MPPCNGRRPQGPYPNAATRSCDTLARHNAQHRNCDKLRGLMVTALTPPNCCGHVCQGCVNATDNACQNRENAIFAARQMPLCKSCQLYEACRHPDGFSSCDCDWNLSRSPNSQWKCIECRYTALNNAIEQRDRTNDWYFMICSTRRHGFTFQSCADRDMDFLVCPGCGKKVPDACADDKDYPPPNRRSNTVTFCELCTGIEVVATTGPNWQASKLAPDGPRRYTPRVRAMNAQKPALSFQAYGQPVPVWSPDLAQYIVHPPPPDERSDSSDSSGV